MIDIGTIWMRMPPVQSGTIHLNRDHQGIGVERDEIGRRTGVRRATLSDPLNSRVSSSPEMGLRFEKAYDVDMDLSLRIQAWYDAKRMHVRSEKIEVHRYEPGRRTASSS